MSGREEYFTNVVYMMDGKDIFIRIGWAPDVVKITNLYDGQRFIWSRVDHGVSGGLGIDVTGGVVLVTTEGIGLCNFSDDPVTQSSDPTAIDHTDRPA